VARTAYEVRVARRCVWRGEEKVRGACRDEEGEVHGARTEEVRGSCGEARGEEARMAWRGEGTRRVSGGGGTRCVWQGGACGKEVRVVRRCVW
jgi:hypothetical protein